VGLGEGLGGLGRGWGRGRGGAGEGLGEGWGRRWGRGVRRRRVRRAEGACTQEGGASAGIPYPDPVDLHLSARRFSG